MEQDTTIEEIKQKVIAIYVILQHIKEDRSQLDYYLAVYEANMNILAFCFEKYQITHYS